MDKEDICEFSPSGSIFAQSTAGIIKFWNADTGVLEHQYHPAEHLAAATTCLRFCPTVNTRGKKKKSKSIEEPPPDILANGQLIALGTLSGKILIYSIIRHELICTLDHSSVAPVTDLLWAVSQSFILVSLASDRTLIKWNVEKRERIGSTDVNGSNAICQYGTNLYMNADMCLQTVKLTKDECILREPYSTGQSVFTLIPIKVCGEKTARYVLSASREDRFVYIWSIEPIERIASFKVGGIVRRVASIVSDGNSLLLAVTTKKGVLKIFKYHLNGKSSGKKPIESNSELIIKSSRNLVSKSGRNPGDTLGIICCSFLSDDTLAFAYNREFPVCETISVDQFDKDVTLVRVDPRLDKTKTSAASLTKTVTPSVSTNATHIMPNSGDIMEEDDHFIGKGKKRKKGDPAMHLPLEECLNALSIKQPPQFSIAGGGAPLNNNIQLLVQGLHSQDDRLLQSILLKGEDEELVNNTVKRLPTVSVEPFIKYLQGAMSKGVRNICYIKWLKSVLNHHMSHLGSMSSKKSLMMPFHSICSARMSSLPDVTKLHSRLSLILTHISTRHENANQKDDDHPALLTYHEESDEDSDRDTRDHRLPSESEDIWDDLSLSDEQEDSEENMEEDRSLYLHLSVGDEQEDGEENMEEDEECMENGDDEREDPRISKSKKKRLKSIKDETLEEDEEDSDEECMENGNAEREVEFPSISNKKRLKNIKTECNEEEKCTGMENVDKERKENTGVNRSSKKKTKLKNIKEEHDKLLEEDDECLGNGEKENPAKSKKKKKLRKTNDEEEMEVDMEEEVMNGDIKSETEDEDQGEEVRKTSKITYLLNGNESDSSTESEETENKNEKENKLHPVRRSKRMSESNDNEMISKDNTDNEELKVSLRSPTKSKSKSESKSPKKKNNPPTPRAKDNKTSVSPKKNETPVSSKNKSTPASSKEKKTPVSKQEKNTPVSSSRKRKSSLSK